MLDTSRDVLNITLSACAIVLTFLLSWLLISCLRIVRTLVDISHRIDVTIRLTEDTLTALHARARDLGSVLPLVVKAIDKLVSYVGERRAKKSPTAN